MMSWNSRTGQALCLSSLAALSLFVGVARAAAPEFPSAMNLSQIDQTTGVRINGADTDGRAGRGVGGAGDVNGDGLDDVLVGSPGAGASQEGAATVIFGQSAPFSGGVLDLAAPGTSAARFIGDQTSSSTLYYNKFLEGAGDVNGDGLDDFLIGAYRAQTGRGSTYVVFGKTAANWDATASLSTLNGGNGFRVDGVANEQDSGQAVAGIGDVNGDGFDDFAIGSPRADPGSRVNAGSTYIFFGKGSAFTTPLAITSANVTINGTAANDRSGFAVAGAGDLNGDGRDDLLVGAFNASPTTRTYAGSVYVVYGKAAMSSTIELSALSSSQGVRIDGAVAQDFAGYSVASAGDFNGDGYSDLIIGAPGSIISTTVGRSYVVFGKAGGLPSVIDLASLAGTDGIVLSGSSQSTFAGGSVSGAGDMDGDGFDDVIVGDKMASPGSNSYAGSTHVVFGSASPTSRDLSALNVPTGIRYDGFRLDGVAPSDFSGNNSAAGDANGDGFDDIVIGAYGTNKNTDTLAGAAYIVFGREPANDVQLTGSAAGQYMSGGPQADTLSGLAGNDRIEGRGDADVLDGGIGIDTASYAHAQSGVSVSLANPGANSGDAAGDSYVSIENLEGSAFSDSLTGNGGANRITGGKGKDTLKGAGGKDIFIFTSLADSGNGTSKDVIADFNPGTSTTYVDRIDLSAMDAKRGVPGNQAFTFIGTRKFARKKGQLRVSLSGGVAVVSGDVNGDGRPDFQLGLKGFTKLGKLTAKDFKL